MAISPSELRANIYRLLDEILRTGVPLEIDRNGRRLRIVAEQPPPRLGRLIPHPDFVVGDSDDLVELDWSDRWSPVPL